MPRSSNSSKYSLILSLLSAGNPSANRITPLSYH
nr:MAG TPA: hypothetical protein [Caudoviricetes sp.]